MPVSKRKSRLIKTPQGLRDEAQPERPEITEARDVEDVSSPGDTNVTIETAKGYVKIENADGSAEIKPLSDFAPRPRTKSKFDDNLAEDVSDTVRARIATRILESIDSDIRSRQNWVDTGKRGIELSGTTLEEANSSIGEHGRISSVKHTGLLKACIQTWANSRSELLPVSGPVKVRDDATSDEILNPTIGHNGGPPLDPAAGVGIAAPQPPMAPGAPPVPPQSASEKRDQLAEDFTSDFNHYLTVVDKDYYPDYSRMLMSRGLLGCQFRKIYVDPILRRPVSRWVKGTNLIVSNEATHLSSAARITEEIQMRQSTVKRMQHIKHWRQCELVLPTTTLNPMEKAIAENEGIDRTTILPADQMHTIYECCTELGEYDDPMFARDHKGRTPGFPLPYRVTIDKDSRQVLEIRRNWKEDDDNYQPRRWYVKYGFVPGLGFYDWGYVHLIGNAQRAATMIEQVLIDTGMLNSFPGGVMAKSPATRQRTTQIRPAPGEFAVIDTGGLPITDFITTWPYKEPSSTLKEMGADLANQMDQIAGIVNLPVGEGMTNVPVGTIMAYIEAISKVPSAVHKDDHMAQQEEFELLRDLFAEDPESLSKFARKPKRQWRAREEIMATDLIPAADPNVPSQVHRLMQTNLLVQTGGLVQFQGIANQRSIWERVVRSLGASSTGEYTIPPAPQAAPPPDPKVLAAQTKAQADVEKAKISAATEDKSDQMRLAEIEKNAEAKAEESALASAENAEQRKHEREMEELRIEEDRKDREAKRQETALKLAADQKKHADNLQHGHAETGLKHIIHKDNLAAQAADAEAQRAADAASALETKDKPAQ